MSGLLLLPLASTNLKIQCDGERSIQFRKLCWRKAPNVIGENTLREAYQLVAVNCAVMLQAFRYPYSNCEARP